MYHLANEEAPDILECFLSISKRDRLTEIMSSSIYGLLFTEYVNGNGPGDGQPDAYYPLSVTPPSSPALHPPSATSPPPFVFSTPTDYQVSYSTTNPTPAFQTSSGDPAFATAASGPAFATIASEPAFVTAADDPAFAAAASEPSIATDAGDPAFDTHHNNSAASHAGAPSYPSFG